MIGLKPNMLKPGMKLVRPAYDFQNILLIDKGVELSERNIVMLKSWGVTRVWVEGMSGENEKQGAWFENEEIRQIEKELNDKFSEVSEDPVMKEILKVACSLLKNRILIKKWQNETR